MESKHAAGGYIDCEGQPGPPDGPPIHGVDDHDIGERMINCKRPAFIVLTGGCACMPTKSPVLRHRRSS